ncbi:MAG: LysR substrate-binding domain-containing protein, partial [Burkholderiales bacterium]
VARHKSYTRAAEELNLSQPAVYIQVKRLEESMGLPLIEQAGKKLLITRAGDLVYDAVVEVLSRLSSLHMSLSDMKGKVGGPLKLAAVTSAKFFLPHILGRFLRIYPDVQPQLTVTNRLRISERLADNLDDFVILGQQIPEPLNLTMHPFMDNPLVLAAHPDHPMRDRKSIPSSELTEEKFLVREAGSGTRSVVEELFSQAGLTLRPYMELGSGEAIKQAIMAGLGVSVIPLASLSLELRYGQIVLLDVENFPLHRTWHVVHLKGKQLGLTAKVFLDFLIEEGKLN